MKKKEEFEKRERKKEVVCAAVATVTRQISTLISGVRKSKYQILACGRGAVLQSMQHVTTLKQKCDSGKVGFLFLACVHCLNVKKRGIIEDESMSIDVFREESSWGSDLSRRIMY